MLAESESSPWARASLVALAALALYLIAFFPMMSYSARRPGLDPFQAVAPWHVLPSTVYQAMFDLWMRIDPVGRANFLNAFSDSRVHLPSDPYP